MLRTIPLYLLFCLAACTIIPDDALEDFPKDVHINQLNLRFLDKNTGELKYVTVNPVLAANKIEINWPNGINIFFYNKDMVKTVYQLSNAGYATKITTSFADGKEIVDEIIYDGSNRVTELKNSFFNDSFKFYYLNNQLDSISKIRTLPNMTTQSGFYKRVNESNFVSIFPFIKTQSYSLVNYYGGCDCTSNAPVPNELNKTGYQLSISTDPNYNQFYTDNTYTQFLNNQYCKQIFSQSVYVANINFYGKPRNLESFASYCYTEDDNYLNGYLLIPKIIPDASVLYLAVVDSEVKWINSNPANSSKWNLAGIDYGYAPSK